ncbi:DUF1654 domain-containing protein [Pseudomonas sp. NPDC088444]|uniref:DUF1654 domain-containing protein n=1 Tax=Pseudomonas sp. NPDC088444 TaxID=3364456 RepID=UPI003850BFD5
MGAIQQQKQHQRVELSGIERLNLRVSNMINHPIAQLQRWVTIHRLDTDGDREWGEVMGVLSEVDEIEMSFNDDESVTLRWEPSLDDDRSVQVGDPFESDEPAPF